VVEEKAAEYTKIGFKAANSLPDGRTAVDRLCRQTTVRATSRRGRM